MSNTKYYLIVAVAILILLQTMVVAAITEVGCDKKFTGAWVFETFAITIPIVIGTIAVAEVLRNKD